MLIVLAQRQLRVWGGKGWWKGLGRVGEALAVRASGVGLVALGGAWLGGEAAGCCRWGAVMVMCAALTCQP